MDMFPKLVSGTSQSARPIYQPEEQQMKKTITKEVNVCDFCETTNCVFSKCLCCGVDICYECRKTKAVHYDAGVFHSSGGDGVYCLKCDITEKSTPLHKAYVAILSLREYQRSWGADFARQQKSAEHRLLELLEQRKSPPKTCA